MAKPVSGSELKIIMTYERLKTELANVKADQNRTGHLLGNRPSEGELLAAIDDMEKAHSFLKPPQSSK